MFELAVMPLTLIWSRQVDSPVPSGDSEESRAFLTELQDELSKLSGETVKWAEEDAIADPEDLEPVFLDPFCLFGLRAAAAWLEFEGDLGGFFLGETPWEHEIFDALEENEGSARFPQLLHSDAELIAFVPAELPEVYLLTSSENPEEEGDDEFAVGSLLRFREELDALSGPLDIASHEEQLKKLMGLGQENGKEPEMVTVEVDLEDPQETLLPARFAWMLLDAQVDAAIERALPLLVFFNDDEAEEEEEDGEAVEPLSVDPKQMN